MSEFCKLHMIIIAQEVERGNAYEMVNSDHMKGFEDKHETAAPDVFHKKTKLEAAASSRADQLARDRWNWRLPLRFCRILRPASCIMTPAPVFPSFPLPCIPFAPVIPPPLDTDTKNTLRYAITRI